MRLDDIAQATGGTVIALESTRGRFPHREIRTREDALAMLLDLGLKPGLARVSKTGIVERYRGNVDLGDYGLDHIPLHFQEITGDLNLTGNNLRDLVGCPQVVGGTVSAGRNKLATLFGAPKRVGRDFLVDDNELRDLEHWPEFVGRDGFASRNPGVPFTRPRGIRGVFHGDTGTYRVFRSALASEVQALRSPMFIAPAHRNQVKRQIPSHGSGKIMDSQAFVRKSRLGFDKTFDALIAEGYSHKETTRLCGIRNWIYEED